MERTGAGGGGPGTPNPGTYMGQVLGGPPPYQAGSPPPPLWWGGGVPPFVGVYELLCVSLRGQRLSLSEGIYVYAVSICVAVRSCGTNETGKTVLVLCLSTLHLAYAVFIQRHSDYVSIGLLLVHLPDL